MHSCRHGSEVTFAATLGSCLEFYHAQRHSFIFIDSGINSLVINTAICLQTQVFGLTALLMMTVIIFSHAMMLFFNNNELDKCGNVSH